MLIPCYYFCKFGGSAIKRRGMLNSNRKSQFEKLVINGVGDKFRENQSLPLCYYWVLESKQEK